MLTFLPLEKIDEMDTWRDAKLNEAKEILAFELTKLVHGEAEAQKAQAAARLSSPEAETTAACPPQSWEEKLTDGKIGILNLLTACGLTASTAKPGGWCSRVAYCRRREGAGY